MADVRRAVRENWDAAGVANGHLVLVACSGGADSLALAAAAAFEGERAGIRVGAVIVEHGLQEATKRVAEQTAVKLMALGLNPVSVVEVSVGGEGGLEAAARDARYSALANQALAHGAKAVMLGHTLNDQAETVLLGLARGSGLRSIAGMLPVTPAGAFLYLRPLLDVTRHTTEYFCRDSGLEFWVDPHNSNIDFTRVRLRAEALPALEAALGPGVAQSLARTAKLAQHDLDYLEAASRDVFKSLAKLGPTAIVLPAAALQDLHPAILGRVLHTAATTIGGQPTKASVDEIAQLVTNWHGQKELTLPGVRVVRQGDDLTFKSTKTLRPGAC